MLIREIVLVGYSGHAYVVADAILSQGDIIKGYCDSFAKSNPLDIISLGNEDRTLLENVNWIVAIGDNSIRQKIIESYEGVGELIIVKHISSIVGINTSIGKGTFLAPNTIINPLVKIGIGCIINTGAIIEHECNIGNFSHLAPGSVLAGNVEIGRNSFIGANAVIKQGVIIGDNVIVGAGSVVLNHIADGMTVVGNPARII